MGLAATIARRSLLQRPGRTLFSVLGVAIGIGTVVFVYALDYNTLIARTATVGPERWQADLEVRPRPGLADPDAELAAVAGVLRAVAHFERDTQLIAAGPRGGPETRSVVKLVALEVAESAGLEAYYLKEGRHIDPAAAAHEVLIGERIAERYAIGPGARVRLGRPPRAAQRVCQDGELVEVEQVSAPELGRPFDVVGVLRPERLGRVALGDVVIVDYRHGREVFAETPIETSYWVQRDPEVGIERLQAGLGQQFTYDLDLRVVVGQTAEEIAFRNGVLAAGLLALALGLYVIFHTLSVSLVERVREVGVLNSLGASRAQVARVFFGEALVIVVAAGAVGLAGGLALARLLLSWGVTTIGVGWSIPQFFVPWRVVGTLCGLGMAIALLGSVYPLVKARHTDVVAALRGEDASGRAGTTRAFHWFAAVLLAAVLPALYFFIVPVVGAREGPLVGAIMSGVAIMAAFLALPLVVPAVAGFACGRLIAPFRRILPLAGELAGRTVERSPTRVASSVSAIALVTTAFVGLKGMTGSLRGEVQAWADQALAHKVWVAGRNPGVHFSFAALEQALAPFRASAPHEALAPQTVLGIESRDASEELPFLVIGLRPEEIAGYGPCARDPRLRAALEQRQGMIVSRRLAWKHGYGVGDNALLQTSGSGIQAFPVVAVSDEYGYFLEPHDERIYGVVAAAHMREYWCKDLDTVSSAAVRLTEDADPGLVEAAVAAALPELAGDLKFVSAERMLGEHVEDLRRDFHLFDLILLLTAALACLGVLNGQLLAALERAKELGVLRALGMSRAQLASTVLLESAVVGGTGGLLGLGLGALLTPVLVDVLQVVSGLALPHVGVGLLLFLCPAGALVATGLAGLYPIWRMSRMDPVAAVRTA